METITGTVDSITFKNKDNTYTVLRLRPDDGGAMLAVVGNFAAPLTGEEIEASGKWVEHPRFGRQFRAEYCRRIMPSSEKGIERFLASGAIKGIGRATAARLMKHFGARVLEVLEMFPHRLTEVEGIGKKKAAVIAASYAEQNEMRELMLLLETLGVAGGYAARIAASLGEAALETVKNEPYRLAAEVDGIGFRIADQIAMGQGWEREAHARLAAGIHYALEGIAQAGHCCVPEEQLVAEAARILTIEPLLAAETVRMMLGKNELLNETWQGVEMLYPPWLYHAEQHTADRLLEIRDAAKKLTGMHEDDVREWETINNVRLAEEQRKAVLAALEYGVLVLTGGPGTGKTTTVRSIIALLEQQECRILLGAPTGRAAKRLSETTGYPAATLHRLLEAAGGSEGAPLFGRNEYNPLEADVVIVDEASMMDISLTSHLLRAVPHGCRFILVGDVDQLPAVGPGAVLKDIIRSGSVPLVRLTEIFRQSGESIIVHNAHRINRGLSPNLNTDADFVFIDSNSSMATATRIVGLCSQKLPQEGFDPITDIQVLSPMHRHECGVENLNRMLQAALNPSAGGDEEVTMPNFTYRVADKVMQRKNNYTKRVFNGDIGIISSINGNIIMVDYPDETVTYEKGELSELQPAYAMSVHKSQGSEYPIVILVLVPEHHIMLQRSLLYTAITRARRRVIIVGAARALETALHNDRTRRRYSLLAERLRKEELC